MAGPPPGSRRRRSSPVDDAFDAVLAQADGKNREEIRQLLKSELTARGVELPDALVWSAADVLAHPHGLTGKVRIFRFGLRMLADMASQSDAISDLFQGGDPGTGAIRDPVARMSAWVQVNLDDHGKAILRSRRKRLGLPAGARDQIAVRLERAGNASLPVDAYVDADRIGTLAPADGRRFVAAMGAPQDHQTGGLLTLGLATIGAESEPELRIAVNE